LEWHDPLESVLAEWRAATHRIFRSGDTSSCPNCGRASLRYFFWRGEPPRPRGGSWVWCPACRSYEHSSVTVPEWWRDIEVPLDQLFVTPGWLDVNWRDDWLDAQPSNR